MAHHPFVSVRPSREHVIYLVLNFCISTRLLSIRIANSSFSFHPFCLHHAHTRTHRFGHYRCYGPLTDHPEISFAQAYCPSSHVMKNKTYTGEMFAYTLCGGYRNGTKIKCLRVLEHKHQRRVIEWQEMISSTKKCVELRLETVVNVTKDFKNEALRQVAKPASQHALYTALIQRNAIAKFANWREHFEKHVTEDARILLDNDATVNLFHESSPDHKALREIYDAEIRIDMFFAGDTKRVDYARLKLLLTDGTLGGSSRIKLIKHPIKL